MHIHFFSSGGATLNVVPQHCFLPRFILPSTIGDTLPDKPMQMQQHFTRRLSAPTLS